MATGELRIGVQVGMGSSFDSFINNPAEVPDGGSTAALLGSVFFAFGILGRKFRKG